MIGSLDDVSQGAALTRSSWGENSESEFFYDEAFLSSCLAYPGALPVIAPACYDGDALVAMVLAMPRTIRIIAEKYQLVLMTCLTVAPQWKGHGLGVAVWAACLRQAHALGYDGAIHYCAENSVSNHATTAGARLAGWEALPLPPVQFVRRLLKPGTAIDAREPSVNDFMSAAATVGPQTPLCRLWSTSEAQWQLHQRSGAAAVTVRSESGPGAITGHVIRLLDTQGTRCLMVDDILWSSLPAAEQAELLARFLSVAATLADIIVAASDLNYSDITMLQNAGFRKSPRVLNAYLTLWNGTPKVDVASLSSMYIDVL